MTPFDEIQFPPTLSYGFTATIDFNNTLIEKDKGYETRVARHYSPRHVYNSSRQIAVISEVAAISAFYVARQGPVRGFRFKDWTDYTSNAADGISAPTANDQLMLATGNPNVFQLCKNYTSGSVTKIRYIFKPVTGTVLTAVSGVPVTTGFTVDTTTGLVTYTVTPGATPTAGFQFDVPVQFGKEIDAALFLVPGGFNTTAIETLPMVEMKILPSSAGVSTITLKRCFVIFSCVFACGSSTPGPVTLLGKACLPVATPEGWILISGGATCLYYCYVKTFQTCKTSADCSSVSVLTPPPPSSNNPCPPCPPPPPPGPPSPPPPPPPSAYGACCWVFSQDPITGFYVPQCNEEEMGDGEEVTEEWCNEREQGVWFEGVDCSQVVCTSGPTIGGHLV